ncbi:hypothetical protein G6F50_018042 [Rhizopus delemar]|uniref:Uncharacterized protein n=1 Tax=Rhizopus delemar TaxID=936053 RepID=A0A9P7BZY1_9FUNG|nr:hypothetical protein G6F50_018042 [Rhizopus delemar]
MRRLYSARRNATAAGLTAALGDRMHIEPQPGGMHLVARMQGQLTDVPLAARMLEQGMYAHPLSRWSTLPDPQSGLLLSFTNIASEAQALELGLRNNALM